MNASRSEAWGRIVESMKNNILPVYVLVIEDDFAARKYL